MLLRTQCVQRVGSPLCFSNGAVACDCHVVYSFPCFVQRIVVHRMMYEDKGDR